MLRRKRGKTLRLFLALIPVVAIVAMYLNTGNQGGSVPPLPLVGGGVVLFLLIFGMAEMMRRAGHGPGVVVDRSKATLSYKTPGRYSTRHHIPLAELKELVVVRKEIGSSPSGPTIDFLFLVTRDGESHRTLYSQQQGVMRRFADELSTLTSVSVREKMD
jgi:hypothetical protein